MVNNTNISITVVNNVNAIIPGATVTIAIAGMLLNLTTDNTGVAATSLNLTNMTVATITVAAPGFSTTKLTSTISPTANTINVALTVDQTQINKILTVVDSTNVDVSNAKVYVNGILAGTTNSAGQIQIIANSGNVTLQVISSNHLPYNLSGSYTPQTFPSKIVILPTITSSQVITLQTIPNAAVTIASNTYISDINGLVITTTTFSPGTYSVTISKSGYTTKTTSITVLSGISTYSLGTLTPSLITGPTGSNPPSNSSLDSQTINFSSEPVTYGSSKRFGASLSGGDPSTSTTTTPGATASPSTTAINTGTLPESEYPPEWIYPNSGDGKYLTGTQARIYIGNLFVDEVDTLYYVYNNNRIPVYGYSSANVDAFGQGRRIVQGQLSINFVSEGYLYTVLSEYKKTTKTNSNLTTAQQQSQLATDNLATLYTQKQALLTQQSNGDNSQATANQLTSISNQILSAQSKLGSGAISAVKQAIANATTATSTSNAIRIDVPFDVIINASGGGRTTTRKLSNCLLTSNEQVWDNSDNAMKDVYGFIGVELV